MSNVFFTSDLHFNHGTEAMIKFRERTHGVGFNDVVDHNLWIVDNLNKHMTKRDHLIIVGDVAFGLEGLKYLELLAPRNKTLIFGNHDKQSIGAYMKYFTKIHGLYRRYGFTISHCPLHFQELLFRNWCLNVHGHIHHIERQPPEPLYYNVNIDVTGCRPIPLEELEQAKQKAEEWLNNYNGTKHTKMPAEKQGELQSTRRSVRPEGSQ